MSSGAVLPITLILGLLILIPLIVGVYVYRDAKRRGMRAGLWALAAALVPALIGLIVYLLVRGNYLSLRCPQCDWPVTAQLTACPQCGTKLRPACPACRRPVEPDWKVCPHCAAPLPPAQPDVREPVRRKDRTVWKVLVVVLVVPALLIALLLFGLTSQRGRGSASFREVRVEDYGEEMGEIAASEAAAGAMQWLEGLDAEIGHAYALRYAHLDGAGGYYFLVYVPGAGGTPSAGLEQSESIFGTALTLELAYTGDSGALWNVAFSGDSAPNLIIRLAGKRIPCEVETVAYNPTVYYIVPQYDALEPGATDFFLPERISVVKLVENQNAGVAEVADREAALDLLADIDSAPYLNLEDDIYGNPDGTGGYTFTDGFDIIIEYRANDALVLHPDMISCLVFAQDGRYYLINADRPDNGRIFREVDEAFYNKLAALFA